MALTFPANPTNGQIYDQYVYDASAQSWRVYGSDTGITNVLDTKASLSGGNTFSGSQTFSSGTVRALTQPSFSAKMMNVSGVAIPINTDLPFDTVRHNVGNHFNTSTRRFTAPVAGSYFFSFHIFKFTQYANGTNTYWGFRVNGNEFLSTNHGLAGSDGGQSLSAIIYLNAGDFVSVQHYGTMQTFSDVYNSFTGYFLG
jgi:hypothetical protein